MSVSTKSCQDFFGNFSSQDLGKNHHFLGLQIHKHQIHYTQITNCDENTEKQIRNIGHHHREVLLNKSNCNINKIYYVNMGKINYKIFLYT